MNIQNVKCKIFRYDGRGRPRWETFEIPVARGMTVLDGLAHLKEHKDSTLAWRSSCRMGICGSCGMLINGRPKLACQTQILEIKAPLVLEPLPNFSVIRDLVPDLIEMFEKHRRVKPWIIRRDSYELEKPANEYLQSAEEMEKYFQFSYCIKCGLCMSACPTLATDARYLGPQPLAQAFRYIADSRDEGFAERSRPVLSEGGPWRCHFAGECSQVCPKHVDPALAVQLMKREILLRTFRLKKSQPGAPIAPKIIEARPRPDIPPAPERTVR
ncbi:MAG: succinate dehydrogenase/fumarate reductase iron-sulfur subunit [candidate division KSB1 bacterium]|nr:succinate dehydrogenase/fumarate reductase iron-sulfur subunit [candidate division KSB1 bacterium]MDZ7368358.1 succinate dehydrogenase/fumarate reductase iron-sulfur subunit [candidate division KSB1 bacterium]MDZ7403078.1 succinate dehydrogenase/fumarate reductase iron-sulfur subunit [candidate division KSB1 bacterium]